MKQELIHIFPVQMRESMEKISWKGLEEIRVRIGKPIEFIYGDRKFYPDILGETIGRNELNEMMNYISGYSPYAMEEEMKQGYITYPGGHRIGLTGRINLEKDKKTQEETITSLTEIGGLNIRIATERTGCAKDIVLLIRKGNEIFHTLFFAAPGVGKTTYLRDAIRILSTGDQVFEGIKCCVIDERSEIGACYDGQPQMNLGTRCDVLDGCPKAVGMSMVLRTMSPQIIAIDELGTKEEFRMLERMRCSGVKVLGTMHGGSIREILENPMLEENIQNGSIERFVQLLRSPSGQRGFRIYNPMGEVLWEK